MQTTESPQSDRATENVVKSAAQKFGDRVPLDQSARPKLRHAIAALLLLALFCATYFLYTRNDDGPLGVHPDEPSKVAQILLNPNADNSEDGERNFLHPLLLLEAADWWVRIAHTPREPQAVVEAGRHASGVFAAVCATGFAGAGYIAFDFVGLFAVAIAVALCPPLLISAHYMKEDAALLSGVGAVVFASAIYWRVASTNFGWLVALPLLGFATAIAPSGKYVGAFSIACALPIVFLAPGIRWWTIPLRLTAFSLSLAITLGAINHRALDDPEHFQSGFEFEYEHGTTGHRDITMDAPNGYILDTVFHECGWHVLLLGAAGFFYCIARPFFRRRGAWYRRNGWLIAAAVMAFTATAVLSMGRIPFERYALPSVVLLHFFAAIAAAALVVSLAHFFSRHLTLIRRSGAIAICTLFVARQAPACTAFTRGFADNGRSHLRQWLADNLPPGTRIAADRYAMLRAAPEPRNPIGQRPIYMNIVSEIGYSFGSAGGLKELRDRGIEYVIVCDGNYERYLTRFAKPMPKHTIEFQNHRTFYESLFREGRLVWQWKPSPPTNSFFNPELRVYRITS